MPNFFNPYQYPPQYGYPMQQQLQQPIQQPIQQPAPQQIQNGGFLIAPNEAYARNYQVALGTSVTFKDEHAPYVYEKTMGFSQLEGPKFEKYRLIKEEPNEAPNPPEKEADDSKAVNDTIENLISEIEAIKADIKGIKERLKGIPKPSVKKPVKEEEYDDE